MFIFFPEPPQGQGMRPAIPNPILEWIRNQIHYITGDDPSTPTVEGTLNRLAESLLQNDRALLDYLDLMASSVSAIQQIMNSISPGRNRIHADNTFSNYHQDAEFEIDLRHVDSLIYSDTWIVGSHQDENYTGNHVDSGYHLDNTIIHSDSHGDHTDHYDQGHGDQASSHSDHSDHLDISHTDSHGDATHPYGDYHGDFTYSVHYDDPAPEVHSDFHQDHYDHVDQAHGDVTHLDHYDTSHADTSHTDSVHLDDIYHANVHGDLPNENHNDAWHYDHLSIPSIHSDYWHYDHTDVHTDLPYTHSDQHYDTPHSDQGSHADAYTSHIDTLHTDSTQHSDQHQDVPYSHSDHSDYEDHSDASSLATHVDTLVHGDEYRI